MCFSRSGAGSRHGLKGRPGEVAGVCGSAMVPCAGGDPATGTSVHVFSTAAPLSQVRSGANLFLLVMSAPLVILYCSAVLANPNRFLAFQAVCSLA